MNSGSVSVPQRVPRVLTIAGTDPTGGAGIQADIRAITAAGGFPYSVVTSVVSQNTTGVQSIFTPPLEVLESQLDSVISDVEIDAVKIGMLGSVEVTEVVAASVAKLSCPIILDPVMVASSGDRLLQEDAEEAVKTLARQASLITPNLPELGALLETAPATDFDAAVEQARQLAQEINAHVLMKGGHFTGDRADNALVSPAGEVSWIPVARVNTKNTHGTGCSLSSALATRIAAGQDPEQAARWATRWLHESIRTADDLQIGHGSGPIDHSHTARRALRHADARPRQTSQAAVAPALIAPAGPHTEKLWELGGRYLTEIMELPFIQDLADGTLALEDFQFYLAQDAFYLQRYSQSLQLLGGEWAVDAEATIAEEQDMQQTWLKDNADYAAGRLSPVTLAYTDFLLARVTTESPAVGEATVLPCYWLYAEVGLRLAEYAQPEHPFHEWLATYAADGFASAAQAAVVRVENSLAQDPASIDLATDAFEQASRYEVDFFAQADFAWVLPTTHKDALA